MIGGPECQCQSLAIDLSFRSQIKHHGEYRQLPDRGFPGLASVFPIKLYYPNPPTCRISYLTDGSNLAIVVICNS